VKLFNCKIRCMGEVKDEVRRAGATNAEIKILRSIHGDDGVVEVEPAGEIDRSEAEERQRLEIFYGEPAVAKLFGIAVPRIADEPSAIDDVLGAVIPIEPPVRAEVRPVKPASKSLQLEDVA
jgi:hypothetical protein